MKDSAFELSAEQMTGAAMVMLKNKVRTKVFIDVPRGISNIEEPQPLLFGKGKGKPINFFMEKKKETLRSIFTAIEQIKGGVLYDPRYGFKQCIIPSPTVWVFMNHAPDVRLLSSDRWKIFRPSIDDDTKFAPKPDGSVWFPKRTTPVQEDVSESWDMTIATLPDALAPHAPPVVDAPIELAAEQDAPEEVDPADRIPPAAFHGGLDEPEA